MNITKSKREVLEEELVEHGVHLEFDKMVIVEGGLEHATAWQRAVTYATECVKVGRPFFEVTSFETTHGTAVLLKPLTGTYV